jgi:hypothetical protein
MSLWLLLSVEAMGTCCSATRRGSSGGGREWAPKVGQRQLLNSPSTRDTVLEGRTRQFSLQWVTVRHDCEVLNITGRLEQMFRYLCRQADTSLSPLQDTISPGGCRLCWWAAGREATQFSAPGAGNHNSGVQVKICPSRQAPTFCRANAPSPRPLQLRRRVSEPKKLRRLPISIAHLFHEQEFFSLSQG